jgi:hypothetical protein
MNQRGQTAYDYLLGIVLLLVAIITVLSLFPQVFGPFVDPVSADQEKMADRVAAEVLDDNATVAGDRTLNVSSLDGNDAYVQRLKERAGVSEYRSLNITVQTGTTTVVQAGDARRGAEPSATTVRTVRTVDGPCEYGCQLVVRVW